jgi:hypothetical protein
VGAAGVRRDAADEVIAVEHHHARRGDGADRGHAQLVAPQGDLADALARLAPSEQPPVRLDLETAVVDDVEAITHVALPDDLRHLGWAEALAARGAARTCPRAPARALDLAREHGYAFIRPRAAAIFEASSRVG